MEAWPRKPSGSNTADLFATLDQLAAPREPTPVPQLLVPGRLFKYAQNELGWPVEIRPHARICNDIDEALGDFTFNYPPGEPHNTMLAYPRNTWKTSLSRAGALLVMEQNPNARQLIACFRHDQATTRCRALRKMVEQYKHDWVPDKNQKLPWSDTAFTIATRTDFDLQEPSVDTTGIERDVTGYHYDVIWMDDIVNSKNYQTRTMRDKAYNFLLDSLAVLKPGGVIVMPCTFWDPDDAYARVIQIDIERSRQNKPRFWNVCVRPAIDPDTGELFYPSVLTREFLEDQRVRMGSHKFSAQYMLQCVSSEDRTFSREHLRIAEFSHYVTSEGYGLVTPTKQLLSTGEWRYVKHTQVPVETTMAWDPAGIKGRQVNDFHGFTLVGCDIGERWWLLAADRRKGPPTDIIEYAVQLILRYRPHTVSCEDVGQSGTWLEMLGMELDRRNIPRPAFVFYNPESVPKNIRISLLQPRWERDGIILQPDQQALRKQFESFSLGSTLDHEDELDSLVQHEAIARPSQDSEMPMLNPIDPEWIAREARLERERQAALMDEGANYAGSGIRPRNVWA